MFINCEKQSLRCVQNSAAQPNNQFGRAQLGDRYAECTRKDFYKTTRGCLTVLFVFELMVTRDFSVAG